jgi:hypothetical protein
MYVYTVRGILTSLDFLTKKTHNKILRCVHKKYVNILLYLDHLPSTNISIYSEV